MTITLPDSINPNDLLAALGAGAQVITAQATPRDDTAGLYAETLRAVRDEVARSSRKSA